VSGQGGPVGDRPHVQPHTAVILRAGGGSSTPRPIGPVIGACGYWVTRPSAQLRTRRVTTTEYEAAFSRHTLPEVCIFFSRPPNQRAQGRPGARRTRGLVCHYAHGKRCTRAYRFGGSIPAFPAQWLYGLLRALPGERLFCLRRPRGAFAPCGLSASTTAPEPHDFTVRVSHTRLSWPPRPSHLTARW